MSGTVTVRYRPLETMDRLHILLAASATLNSSICDLESLFSLPFRVIDKECGVLERYGICYTSDGHFRLTERGVDVLSMWNLLGKADSVNIESTGQDWMLGPGSFCIPGTIRDFRSCRQKAEQSGITMYAGPRCLDHKPRYLS